jgi:hypothetical protein
MVAVFQVGDAEKHSVEVFSSFWKSRDIVMVDGVVVLQKYRPLIWFKDRVSFQVGEKEKHHVELVYSAIAMTSQAYVDGQLYIACLFPQVPGYNALGLALLAVAMAVLAVAFSALTLIRH